MKLLDSMKDPRVLCNWAPWQRHHDAALHRLDERDGAVDCLAPARYAPALFTPCSSLFKIGELPEVMDDVQVAVMKPSALSPCA